jgi:hypothetical protein
MGRKRPRAEEVRPECNFGEELSSFGKYLMKFTLIFLLLFDVVVCG